MDKKSSDPRNSAALQDSEPKENRKVAAVPDDLSALLHRASLGKSSYREFPNALQARRGSRAVDEATADRQATESAAAKQSGKVGEEAIEPGSNRKQPDQAPDAVPSKSMQSATNRGNLGSTQVTSPDARRIAVQTENNSTQSQEASAKKINRLIRASVTPWPALDNLFFRNKQSFNLIQGLAANIKIPLVFVSSLAGGAGGTTISATLGRCLAGWGDRVAIAETQASLVLPYHYSARESGDSEILRFDVPGSHQSVQVIRGVARSQTMTANTPNLAAEVALLERLRESAAVSDRLFLDASRLSVEDILATDGSMQTILIPIVPDLVCALNVLDLEERLAPELANLSRSNPPYYVLNKFDSTLALHRDIQVLLKSSLGNRLLPILIHSSDAVPEALARGMTVIDYCPEAGVAQDFLQLAEWVRTVTPGIETEAGDP
ncbi:MAG: cellulose synthase operon protein YhjQ/BcsQ [Candidatus Acidiferrum sp.]